METKISELPIIEVDHGIANNFGTHIEINKHLKEFPVLYDKVIKHEFGHTEKLFSWKDMFLDLSDTGGDSLLMLRFMLKYPRSFSQILPFYYSRKKGFCYDVNLTIIYSVIIVIAVAVASAYQFL